MKAAHGVRSYNAGTRCVHCSFLQRGLVFPLTALQFSPAIHHKQVHIFVTIMATITDTVGSFNLLLELPVHHSSIRRETQVVCSGHAECSH